MREERKKRTLQYHSKQQAAALRDRNTLVGMDDGWNEMLEVHLKAKQDAELRNAETKKEELLLLREKW